MKYRAVLLSISVPAQLALACSPQQDATPSQREASPSSVSPEQPAPSSGGQPQVMGSVDPNQGLPSSGGGATSNGGGATSNRAGGGSVDAGLQPSTDAGPPEGQFADCTRPELAPVLDDIEGYSTDEDITVDERWAYQENTEIASVGEQAYSTVFPDGDIRRYGPPGVAQSGTQSVLLVDRDGGLTPELRADFEDARRGVFKTAMHIVPGGLVPRHTVLTIQGTFKSFGERITGFRFRADGGVDHQIGDSLPAEEDSWFAVSDEPLFAPNTWFDVEIAWDTRSGCNKSWLTVGDAMYEFEAHRQEPSTGILIRKGENMRLNNDAGTFFDDWGYATE